MTRYTRKRRHNHTKHTKCASWTCVEESHPILRELRAIVDDMSYDDEKFEKIYIYIRMLSLPRRWVEGAALSLFPCRVMFPRATRFLTSTRKKKSPEARSRCFFPVLDVRIGAVFQITLDPEGLKPTDICMHRNHHGW